MKARCFGCGKFRRLLSDGEDRDLVPRESAFMEKHRNVCSGCANLEASSAEAFRMLRQAAVGDVVPAFHFDDHVLRRAKLQTVRDSFSYWTPAFMGAGLAGAALISILYLLGKPAQSAGRLPLGGEARMMAPSSGAPNLDLKGKPISLVR